MKRMAWLMVLVIGVASARGAATADPLAEQIAPYKKPGEKLEKEDFAVAPVPEADNAALELRAAVKLVKHETPEFRAWDKIDNFQPPLNDATVKILRSVVAENQPVITHVDAAMRRKSVDWQIVFKSPVLETLLPHLNDMRLLSNILAAHADLAHHDGNDVEALHDVERILFISRAVDHEPFVVTHLVSVGISNMACALVERIVPDMKTTDPKQVKELIAMLLDDGPQRAGMHDALLAERMSHIDNGRCLLDGRLKPERLRQLAGGNPRGGGPQFPPDKVKADVAMLLAHSTAMIEAFDATSNWPAYKARDPGVPAELNNNRQNHPYAGMMLASMTRAFETHYRAATERRLAAIVLAARAYANAHDGKLPASLDALVPEYFAVIPDDPMAAAATMQYLNDPDRPIVYSVGTNGMDDAGSEGNPATPGRWQQNDAVMHLSRPAGAGAAAAKAK